MTKLKEIWKDIQGHEGRYQISNLSRVRSLDAIRKTGRGTVCKKGQIISWYMRNGYVYVTLSTPKQDKSYRIHRLVAQAFIPNEKNLPWINHKNGIRNDNRIENLEWCTPSGNMLHAMETGLVKSRILNLIQVRVVREAIAAGFRNQPIANYFRVSRSIISKIKVGDAYANIGTSALSGTEEKQKPDA